MNILRTPRPLSGLSPGTPAGGACCRLWRVLFCQLGSLWMAAYHPQRFSSQCCGKGRCFGRIESSPEIVHRAVLRPFSRARPRNVFPKDLCPGAEMAISFAHTWAGIRMPLKACHRAGLGNQQTWEFAALYLQFVSLLCAGDFARGYGWFSESCTSC